MAYYAVRRQAPGRVATTAVASTLLVISCVDGFLKNTHGDFLMFILKDVALIGLLLAVVFVLASNPDAKPRGRWQGAGIWGLFFAYMVVESVNPGTGDISSGIAGFRAEALFSLLFVVGAVFFTNVRRLTNTVNVAIAAITLASLAGVFETLLPSVWNSLSPGLANASLSYTAWESAGEGGLLTAIPRAYGTLVDPAALGIASCVGFLLASGALARAKGAARAYFLTTMAVMAAALLFSGSRASVVGFGAGLAVFVVLSWRDRGMRVPAAIAFVLVLIALPFALHDTVAARFSSTSIDYAAATRARSEHIVLASLPSHPFGLGLGATGAGGRRIGSGGHATLAVDNVYFAMLYQTGPVGFAIFVALQGAFLFLIVRGARNAKSLALRATYVSMASLQVAMLVNGFWNQGAFTYAPVAQVFWLLSGAIALPHRLEK
jgi:hypothetical protein